MNVPVCWRSKAQRGMTLSSSKAEYVAISEAVKEIKFIYYPLREIGIEVNLPITVKTDNIGTMFMAQNVSSDVTLIHVMRIWKKNHQYRIFQVNLEIFQYIFTKNVHVTKFLGVHAEECKHWTFRHGRVLEIYSSCSDQFRY
jgi:hypothetical protein